MNSLRPTQIVPFYCCPSESSCAAGILRKGWSAGLQPASGVRKRKAGFKSALRFGGGSAALSLGAAQAWLTITRFACGAWLAACLGAGVVQGAGLVVPPGGLGPLTFDTTPPVSEWSTLAASGSGITYQTIAALEANVQTLTALDMSTALSVTTTIPPSTSTLARHNMSGFFLQTRPVGSCGYIVLMATLFNNTGSDASLLRVAYDLNSFSPQTEEIPGLRAYYSLTGAANSWHLIPELTSATTGALSAEITLVGLWPQSSQMHLIWVDDNSNGTADPSYTIDNVVISAQGSGMPGIEILTPTNGQAFVQSQLIAVTTRVSGLITNAEVLLDDVVVGTDSTPPFEFSLDTTSWSLGSHTLRAHAFHSTGTFPSTNAVVVNILSNAPPFLALDNPQIHPVLVGTAVTNYVTATDDLAVVRVDWYLGDTLTFTRSNAPWHYVYTDALPTTNFPIRAVAFDTRGLSVAATNWVTVTNPAPNIGLILTNGAEWQYFASTSAPPVQGALEWHSPGYDRSTWPSGFAELGAGDGAFPHNYNPERTVIEIRTPTTPSVLYTTIYFAKEFDWPDRPADCASYALVVRLLRDDGAAVYLNGVPIWTNNLVLNNGYDSFASYANDDGLEYLEVRLSCQNLRDLGTDLRANNNLIAVEVHQQNAMSSDLSFDLMLWSEPYSPQALAVSSPTNGTPILQNSTGQVQVASSPFVRAVEIQIDGIPVAFSSTHDFTLPGFLVQVPFNVSTGLHTLQAIGSDSLLNTVTSAPVMINVFYDGERWVGFGAVWKYDDTGTDLGTAWRSPAFDDSGWSAGPAELGYGQGDEATVISYGPDASNKRPTAYFRHAFEVPEPAAVSNLSVRVKRDDGVVVYLNGTEVLRNNMPAGTIAYATLASGNGDEGIVTGCVPQSLLVAGRNVIAAEVHQVAATSSDLSFDLALVAPVPATPPTVALTEPTNGASFVAGDAIILAATASDADCAVDRVEFYVGNTLLSTDFTAPFQRQWTALPGNHVLTAKVIDSHGLYATASIVVTVHDAFALVNTNAVWNYLDDGSDQGVAWRTQEFDDRAWASGPAPLGYHSMFLRDDFATVVSYGPNPDTKYATTYFRRRFSYVPDSGIEGLVVRLMRDDGGVVYLNGNEVFRSNITNNPVLYTDYAVESVGSDFDRAFFRSTNILPNLLLPTTNVLAVEIHQATPFSPDIVMELQLLAYGPANLAPRLSVTLVDHDGNSVTPAVPEIRWSGSRVLQEARDPAGPWTDRLGQGSPYRPDTAPGRNGFFRLR